MVHPDRGVALVTGAARRIGRAIALDLAEAGYAVAIHCNRSIEEAEEVAEHIRLGQGRATVIAADLSDSQAVAGIMAAAEAALGRSTCSSTTPRCSSATRCSRSTPISTPATWR